MAISLTYTFTAGTLAQAAQVNANFSTLATRALDKTGDTMTGTLLFTDATYDIGASGATRPRDFYLSRHAVIGGNTTITGTLGVTGAPTFTVPIPIASGGTGAATASANVFFAGPTSGGAAAPSFRSMVAADLSSAGLVISDGTWTPVLGGSGGTSGQTYTTQAGIYVKIGRMVWASFDMVLTAKGTITTNLQLQGLPFTVENTAGNKAVAAVTWANFNVTGATTTYGVAEAILNTTTAGIYSTSVADDFSNVAALTQATTTNVQNNTQMRGTLIYRVAS